MSDTPRTDELAQKFSITWNQFAYRSDEDIAKQFQNTDDALDIARQLERELAEAKAEIVRLKGEAESWEKVFDRTCEHLADAKTELAEANARLDWLDTVPCGIFHKGYGEYRYYIGDGFTKKAREVIDAAMKECGE